MTARPGFCPRCGSDQRFGRPEGCPHTWHTPPEEAALQAEAAKQIREEAEKPITDQHAWHELVSERFATLLLKQAEQDEK